MRGKDKETDTNTSIPTYRQEANPRRAMILDNYKHLVILRPYSPNIPVEGKQVCISVEECGMRVLVWVEIGYVGKDKLIYISWHLPDLSPECAQYDPYMLMEKVIAI